MSKDFLSQIPPEILLSNLFTYLNGYKEISKLSLLNRYFYHLIFSKKSISLWNQKDFQVFKLCIDGYCPNCHVNLLEFKSNLSSAFQFISHCPLKRIQVHIFLADISKLLIALSKINTVEFLELRVTNQTNSPTLAYILESNENLKNLPYDSFIQLKALSIDSSYLKHINIAGRCKLLELLGSSLTSLEFKIMSPTNSFSMIKNRCPNLIHLRMDKPLSIDDLYGYMCPSLESLDIRRCGFVPKLNPSLMIKKFRFSASYRVQFDELRTLIKSIPKTVSEIYLEAPYCFLSPLLFFLANELPNIQSLTLEGSHENGILTTDSMNFLARNCRDIRKLCLISSSSTNILKFESPFELEFFSHCNLQEVTLDFNLDLWPEYIHHLLQKIRTIKSITFILRKRIFGTSFDLQVYIQQFEKLKTALNMPSVNIHFALK